jgi:hypothetical protein
MSRTEAGRRIMARAARCGTVTETLSAGDNVKAGTSEFRILYPSAGLDASGNDASMVFEYKDGWMNALFTGDIGFEGEEEMLANMASYGSTDITYLKAAHHGSKNSTSDEFLEAATPEICVISAPESSFYGHPHRELLERLENAGARFFQTGKGGAVKEGVKKSLGDWILFMDADLSTDLSAIKTVLDNIDNQKIIIGSRRHKDSILIKKQGLIRKFIGICCIVLTNLITRLWLLDTQCGFKALEANLAKQIIQKQTIEKWAFDVEWLYIAKVNGFRAKEIPVKWDNDEDSKVSVMSSSVKFFIDLFKIVKNKKLYKF